VGAVLVELSGLAATIRFAVIVLPLTAPLTCTALPTANWCWVSAWYRTSSAVRPQNLAQERDRRVESSQAWSPWQ
jgi:hypothetical protein